MSQPNPVGILPGAKYLPVLNLVPVYLKHPYSRIQILDHVVPSVLGNSDWASDRQMRARTTFFIRTSPVHNSVKKIRLSLVLNPILKLLSRPVVCAPLKGLEINM
jgi:hypothetical protein